MPHDRGVIFDDGVRDQPRAHVFIVGVGCYAYGRGNAPSIVADGLAQLTSPPVSAMLVADWFKKYYRNDDRPLGSLRVFISDEAETSIEDSAGEARPVPRATLDNIEAAMETWRDVIGSHPENMIVFYFCGHGVTLGQNSALLLEDFGKPGNSYKAAIDVNTLIATLKNCPATYQLFLLDCCRSPVDALYQNEVSIGTRVLSIEPGQRVAGTNARQCILSSTADRERAFGVVDSVSLFTSCFLDAVEFAAVDDISGRWGVSTPSLLRAIDLLLSYRAPAEIIGKMIPIASDIANFEFSHADEPTRARSVVGFGIEDAWLGADLSIVDVEEETRATVMVSVSREALFRCHVVDLDFGTWEFRGKLSIEPPMVQPVLRKIRGPVSFVKMELAT